MTNGSLDCDLMDDRINITNIKKLFIDLQETPNLKKTNILLI